MHRGPRQSACLHTRLSFMVCGGEETKRGQLELTGVCQRQRSNACASVQPRWQGDWHDFAAGVQHTSSCSISHMGNVALFRVAQAAAVALCAHGDFMHASSANAEYFQELQLSRFVTQLHPVNKRCGHSLAMRPGTWLIHIWLRRPLLAAKFCMLLLLDRFPVAKVSRSCSGARWNFQWKPRRRCARPWRWVLWPKSRKLALHGLCTCMHKACSGFTKHSVSSSRDVSV